MAVYVKPLLHGNSVEATIAREHVDDSVREATIAREHVDGSEATIVQHT